MHLIPPITTFRGGGRATVRLEENVGCNESQYGIVLQDDCLVDLSNALRRTTITIQEQPREESLVADFDASATKQIGHVICEIRGSAQCALS